MLARLRHRADALAAPAIAGFVVDDEAGLGPFQRVFSARTAP
jgi:hypothetical protein